jgi:uncharacterized protein (TIGR00369 family)
VRPIKNPFVHLDGYNCFGCCPDNENGLRLRFEEDGDWVVSKWTPTSQFEGYHGVLHGGIQSTLFDEVGAWVIYVKAATAGVTGRMDVRYRKPVFINKGDITLRGRLLEHNRRLAKVEVELLDASQQVCAQAIVEYFLFSSEKAKSEYYYPGLDSFFE